MNIFEKSKYKIPIKFETDDIENEVSKLLESYKSDIQFQTQDEKICDRLEMFNKYCKLVYGNYFRGWHSAAFDNFKKAIKALDLDNNPILKEKVGNDLLYRGRINSSYQMFKFEDMVHIPLDSRYLVQTQRFSFPGLPCFYAGASVYSCWNKLNKPTIDSFQVASFRPDTLMQEKLLLNLSEVPTNKLEPDEDYYYYWPLLALCSIKVRHEDAHFKPEYIFPQYLLEYIQSRNSDIVGIKYASIKVLEVSEKQIEEDWHTYVNYVFPTQSDSCFSKLDERITNSFSLVKNRSGKEIQIIRDYINRESTKLKWQTIGESDEKTFDDIMKNRRIVLEGGEAIPYIDTIFGITEKALNMDVTNEI